MRSLLLLALGVSACSAPRAPRPTILNAPPPVPPPGADEARLEPLELQPDAREPVETVPSASLFAMARRALDDSQGSIVRCYERVLVEHPNAEGSVEVQLDLGGNGAVTRAHLDQRGRDGFEGVVPCLEGVFREVRVRDVQPHGQYVSRVYSFQNPTLDRAVGGAIVITAPAPPPRPARRRRGAPPPEAPAAPAVTPVPPPGPGSLRLAELRTPVAESAALPACAALALRRARRPPGPVVVRFGVSAHGAVTEAAVEATPPLAPDAVSCVADAMRALHFRESGITLRATVTLDLRGAAAPAVSARRRR